MGTPVMNWKHVVVYAILAPTLALAITVLFYDMNTSSIILTAVAYYTGIPLFVSGIYMWVTGRGYRWMNTGVDWRALTEEEAGKCASYTGIFLAIGSIFLMFSIASITTSPILLVILILLALGICLVPVKLAFEKYRRNLRDIPSFTTKKAWALVMAVTVVTVVPCGYLLADTTAGVTVEYDDYTIVIVAPMVKYTLDRSKISEVSYVDDFVKGSRVNGFADGTVCTGLFKNNLYGDYRLAAYAKVAPCITLKYDGMHYAFNQSTAEATLVLFNQIFK